MLEILKAKIKILHELGGMPYAFLANILGVTPNHLSSYYGVNATNKLKGESQELEVHMQTLDYLMEKLIREYNKTKEMDAGKEE